MQAQRAIKDLTDREHQLKEQLNIYTAKYDDFQQSLQKSNEVFGSYKVELEKMSKHTKKIEKEALGWRQKYEKANAMVIDLATEKSLQTQHSERLQKQYSSCRSYCVLYSWRGQHCTSACGITRSKYPPCRSCLLNQSQ